MIYLIGGSPRCGKTTVAKQLSLKTTISWCPADYLGAAVFQYIPEKEHPDKFPLSEVHSENPTNDFLYSKHSADEIVSFYDIQAKAVWSGIRAFIKYAAHDKQDFIIEGYQITPELLSELDPEVLKDVKAVFLYKKDVTDIEAGMKKNSGPGDWLIKNTKEDATFGKVAKMVALFGDRTISEAAKYDMPVFNMDGDFSARVDDVVNTIVT